MRCLSQVLAVLASLLGACERPYPAVYPETWEAVTDGEIARRNGASHPRRDRNPTGASSDDEEVLCSVGEERWVRVPCAAHGVDDSAQWYPSQQRWVCVRCLVDVCGEPMESGNLPQLYDLRTCPEARTPLDNGDERPRQVRR